jgi:hypothetical protein
MHKIYIYIYIYIYILKILSLFTLSFLTIGISAWRLLMQRGRFVDLLPCVICLGFSRPNFIVSNFKFKVKSSCILIIRNDHVVKLVNLINMSTYWLGWFDYFGLFWLLTWLVIRRKKIILYNSSMLW